ncbi:MAG: hypothetical protein ACYTE3_27920 [Planctomycetota bacterium]
MNMPKHVRFVVAASIVVCAVSSVYALFSVGEYGEWPASWPKELEPLRKQSRTLSDGMHCLEIYEIPFTDREQFESAWPHILKVKSNKAPLKLLSSPYHRTSVPIKAGVRILAPRTATLVFFEGAHCPPEAKPTANGGKALTLGPPWPDYIKSESGSLPGYIEYDYRKGKWVPYDPNRQTSLLGPMKSRVDIELIVDGQIVDLNRIPLPADTLIIDKRFQDRRRE